MPQPGMRWRFVTINTKNSWHHGGPRGFRSRDHRIHSNGDYRNPPPRGEHEGLLRYRLERTGPKVVLPRDVRPRVAMALVEHLTPAFRFKALAVSSDHAHLLIELPDSPKEIRQVIGNAKRHASRGIRDLMPGAVWSSGCDYTPVDDLGHFDACVIYVLTRQGHGAWTWSHQTDGMWHEDRTRANGSRGVAPA